MRDGQTDRVTACSSSAGVLHGLNHLLIADLVKLAVELAHCIESFRRIQADHFVGIRPHALEAVGGRHGYGTHQHLRLLRARGVPNARDAACALRTTNVNRAKTASPTSPLRRLYNECNAISRPGILIHG